MSADALSVAVTEDAVALQVRLGRLQARIDLRPALAEKLGHVLMASGRLHARELGPAEDHLVVGVVEGGVELYGQALEHLGGEGNRALQDVGVRVLILKTDVEPQRQSTLQAVEGLGSNEDGSADALAARAALDLAEAGFVLEVTNVAAEHGNDGPASAASVLGVGPRGRVNLQVGGGDHVGHQPAPPPSPPDEVAEGDGDDPPTPGPAQGDGEGVADLEADAAKAESHPASKARSGSVSQ